MPVLVWLSETDAEQIRTDADHFYVRETGGTLMGYWADGHQAVVTKLIPAGPKAHHGLHNFKPDQQWQLEAIARHYESSARKDTYLGDWHTHPDTEVPTLSWTDRACLRAIIRTPQARNMYPIMMLVCGSLSDWTLHPKVCRLVRRYRLFDRIVATDATVRTFGGLSP